MARISYVEKEQAEPKVRELYEAMTKKGWPVGNLFKVMGHCPYIGLNFQRLGTAILTGEVLDPRLRELAILRVGHLCKSDYEFTKHTVRGKREGLKQIEIDAIPNWKASTLFSDKERALLAFTDELSQNIEVKDETFANLRKHFSEHEAVELATTIGYYGLVCRILVGFRVELES